MRVLFVSHEVPADSAPGSGVQRYVQLLTRDLAKQVTFEYLDMLPNVKQTQNSQQTPMLDTTRQTRPQCGLYFGLKLFLSYFKECCRRAVLLRRASRNVDLLHVNRVGCEVDAIAARWFTRLPVVGTIHNLPGLDAVSLHPVRRFVEWLSLHSVHHCIAVSAQTKNEWMVRTRLDGRRITVVFNGMPPVVDVISKQLARNAFKVPKDAFAVGICARLHRMKGHGVLLDALSALSKVESRKSKVENVPILLLIAGEGPLEAELKAQVERLGLENCVRFVGFVDDPLLFLAALDLQVLPSIELECLPYSIVEGMHLRLPTICSDVGGTKEIITASGGGTVVPAGDTNSLAAAILAYITDRNRCLREGTAAQIYAREYLTAEKMAAATLRVYQHVLARQKKDAQKLTSLYNLQPSTQS